MPNLDEVLELQTRISGVRANFVANRDGSFVGDTGSSHDLSNVYDKRMLIKLRSLADVIVTDAATARRENYRPSRWAPIQIWSKTGNFDQVEPVDGIEFVQSNDLASTLTDLKLHYDSVLLETGPNLTFRIAQLGFLDELKLTLVGCSSIEQAIEAAKLACTILGAENFKLKTIDEVEGNYFLTLER